MKLHNLLTQTYETFIEQAQNTRAILLHPQSRYRSVLLARLMNAPDTNVFYYALGPDDITLKSFITGVTHDLANQHPTFGRHLNMLPPRVHENFDAHFNLVLDTFAAELQELSSEPFYLVFDEYDRCDGADDVQLFTEKLVARLPDHGHMVINSRTLPRLPWVSMIAKGDAVLLVDDHIISEKFYGVDQTQDAELEVYGLGPGFVLLNGEPIDNWEGHLPRLLFFFALDRPVVTRSEICQAFWPDLDSDQAVNVFHVTKRRLHKALDLDILVHDGTYYSVNPELTIYYDVMEFVEVLMRGREDVHQDKLFEAWLEADRIYRGPFLQGHSDEWIVNRRDAFQSGYLEAVTNIARVYKEQGRLELALKTLQRAEKSDDRREDIQRGIMGLYYEMGRRSEAIAHFQKFADRLDSSKLKPEDETHALYEEILAEE